MRLPTRAASLCAYNERIALASAITRSLSALASMTPLRARWHRTARGPFRIMSGMGTVNAPAIVGVGRHDYALNASTKKVHCPSLACSKISLG
jgi:hypothetical protein